MDNKQPELRKETLFKNSILSSAEAKSMSIIAEAERKRQEDLEAVRLSCEKADQELIAARYMRGFEKELSAQTQQARKELLLFRAQLAEELFATVEQQLQAFAQGPDYKAWLTARLKKYAQLSAEKELTLYLHKQDLPLAEELAAQLHQSNVQETTDIQIGGFKISDGHRLFDETLDAGLALEKEKFYSGNTLPV